MERVKKGEKYWFISGLFTVEARYESNGIMDTELFKVNNYFPASDYTPKMVNEMAEKIRKVLKGAIVVEPMTDDDEFATEVTFNGDCKIIPPKNHLIGTMITTKRGCVVEFVDKSQLTKED